MANKNRIIMLCIFILGLIVGFIGSIMLLGIIWSNTPISNSNADKCEITLLGFAECRVNFADCIERCTKTEIGSDWGTCALNCIISRQDCEQVVLSTYNRLNE